MKLINGLPFIDLSNFIDLKKFDQLQPEIWRGLARSKHLAQIGNLDIDPLSLDLDGSELSYIPLCAALQDFNALEEDNIIKITARDLTKDELATYLKYAVGGYDLYITYSKSLFEEFFSGLDEWIQHLINSSIFERIDDYYIMTMEAGGVSFDHRHPPIDQTNLELLTEFIHIRPNLDRPFYIRNSKTLEKYYINTRVAYWNDQGRHGGDSVMKNTYAMRIDGQFTEEFRNKILK